MTAEAAKFTEQAPAKVNLYLHLCGQRDDGYHLLDSLAVFPSIGDVLSTRAGTGLTLDLTGPQSAGLTSEPDNLVLRAARGLMADGAGAALTLEKNLPVASGIGGGSSDAAAALRLLSRLWACEIPDALPLSLGADVPVCMSAPRPMRMQGIGEVLTPVPNLPKCGIVLVNPMVEVPTGAVFKGVADRNPPPGPKMPNRFEGFTDFAAWLKLQRNDLQPSAQTVCPEISQVLDALQGSPLARMSGSGATCFALFPSSADARNTVAQLQQSQPNWWVQAASF